MPKPNYFSNKGGFVPLTYAAPALKFTYDATISTSTEITLQEHTSLIEVTALDDNVFLRYGTSDAVAATDGADEFIPAGTIRHYEIGKDDAGNKYTAINVISETGGVVIIEK